MKNKDFYDNLRDKTNRIVKEGLRLSKRKKSSKHYCVPNCVSCLAAEARGNVDDKDYGIGFSSSEDVCMLDARGILASKLKDWIIN